MLWFNKLPDFLSGWFQKYLLMQCNSNIVLICICQTISSIPIRCFRSFSLAMHPRKPFPRIFWTISLHVSFSPGGKPHGELLCDESRAEGKAWAEPLRARRAHRPSSPRVAVTKQLTSCSLPLLELSEVTAALPCRFMNRSVARWMMLQLARKGSEPADERARQRKGAFSCKRHLWPWGLFWGVLFSSQLAAGGRRMRVLYSLSSYKQESFDYLAYFSCALQMCAHRTWAWLPVLRMLSTEEAILNKKRL